MQTCAQFVGIVDREGERVCNPPPWVGVRARHDHAAVPAVLSRLFVTEIQEQPDERLCIFELVKA
jgi:hypothetical protein